MTDHSYQVLQSTVTEPELRQSTLDASSAEQQNLVELNDGELEIMTGAAGSPHAAAAELERVGLDPRHGTYWSPPSSLDITPHSTPRISQLGGASETGAAVANSGNKFVNWIKKPSSQVAVAAPIAGGVASFGVGFANKYTTGN